MDVTIGFFRKPPSRCGLQILQVLESAPTKEITLYIFERGFDFSFSLGASRATSDRSAVVMGDESREGRVEHGLSRFPSQYACS